MKNKNIIISVIVVAYNRKTYINQALNSLKYQSLSKDIFEVIVISNFEVDLTSYKNINIKHIKLDGSIGEFFSYGIKESNGEVICILEDDDLFHRDKLKILYDTYVRFNFDYYKNNLVRVDESCKIIHDYPIVKTEYLLSRRSFILKVKGDIDISKIKKTLLFRGNPSTIAFKKKAILGNLEDMRRITSEIGHFIFYTIFDNGGVFFYDKRKLTRYRISEQSDSNSKHFKSRVIIRNSYLPRTIKTDEILLGIIKSDYIKRFLILDKSVFENEFFLINQKRPKFKIYVNSLIFGLLYFDLYYGLRGGLIKSLYYVVPKFYIYNLKKKLDYR